jgi:hypothetical protein
VRVRRVEGAGVGTKVRRGVENTVSRVMAIAGIDGAGAEWRPTAQDDATRPGRAMPTGGGKQHLGVVVCQIAPITKLRKQMEPTLGSTCGSLSVVTAQLHPWAGQSRRGAGGGGRAFQLGQRPRSPSFTHPQSGQSFHGCSEVCSDSLSRLTINAHRVENSGEYQHNVYITCQCL